MSALAQLAAEPARPAPAAVALPARPAAAPMIRTAGLGRQFGGAWAIRDVDLEIAPGEVLGLLGPNGAGKTTTVRLLTALLAPSAGNAWIDGVEVTADPDQVRRRVGLLTETPSLYERLTAWENLEFFGRLNQVPRAELARRIERWLRLFELWDRRNDRVGGFSKGMKQKVAIVRTLLHEPRVIFLDEPTSGLDPEAAFLVREAMARLKADGRTIVLATHNLDEAERLADRVAFIRGRIVRIDSPAHLRRREGGTTIAIELAADPAPAWIAAVEAEPVVRSVEAAGRVLTVGIADRDRDTPAVLRAAVAAGAPVIGVTEVVSSLEQVYFDVFGLRPGTNGAN